jgi:hypothetical protein
MLFLDRLYPRIALSFDCLQLMGMLLFALSKPLGCGGGFLVHFGLQRVAVTFEQAIPET